MKAILLVLSCLFICQSVTAEGVGGIKRVPIKSCSAKCQNFADNLSNARYKLAVERLLFKAYQKKLTKLQRRSGSGDEIKLVKITMESVQKHIDVYKDLVDANRNKLQDCEKKYCQPGADLASALRGLGVVEKPAKKKALCASCEETASRLSSYHDRLEEINRESYDAWANYYLAEAEGRSLKKIQKKLQELLRQRKLFRKAAFEAGKFLDDCNNKKCASVDDRQSMLLPSETSDSAYAYAGAATGLNKSTTNLNTNNNEEIIFEDRPVEYGHENSDTNYKMFIIGLNKSVGQASFGAEVYVERHGLSPKTVIAGSQIIREMGIDKSMGIVFIPGVKVVNRVTLLAKLGLARGNFKVVTLNNMNFSKQVTGAIVGGGVLFDLTNRLGLRLAASHTSYDNVSRIMPGVGNIFENYKLRTTQYETALILKLA